MNNSTIISLEESKEFQDISKFISTNDDYFILVIGYWGSGKTELINQIFKRNNIPTQNIDLSDCTSLLDALNTSIPKQFRFLVFILLSAVYFCLASIFTSTNETGVFVSLVSNNHSNFLIYIITITVFSINSSSFKILNWVYSTYYWLFNRKSSSHKTVLFVDDIDRSSLTANEIFNYLKHIKLKRNRTIVCLGYSRLEERDFFLLAASKLNAKFFIKDTSENIFHSIIRQFDKHEIYLKSSTWMSKVPLREIIQIFEHSAIFCNSEEETIKYVVLNIYNKLLQQLLGTEASEKLKNSLALNDALNVALGSEIINGNLERYTSQILHEYTNSVRPELFKKYGQRFIIELSKRSPPDSFSRVQATSAYFKP